MATRFYFSQREIKDLALASGDLLLAFSILWIGSASILEISIAVLTGFVIHELAHKFLAQHLRYHAEFVAWKIGLVLAVLSSFAGFIFAAPGAVQIGPKIDLFGMPRVHKREYGLISLVGPLSNIVIATVFLFLIPLSSIFSLGIFVNLFLAGFNMIPFPPFDGSKVWRWNKAVWGATMAAIIGLGALVFAF